MLFIIIILSHSGRWQGLDDEYQEEGKLLGHYTYQEDGESLQSFDVMVTSRGFFVCFFLAATFATSLTTFSKCLKNNIFDTQELNDKTFQIIEVRVLSNWGHPEYTCLYRFRVHGEPRPQ